MWVLVEAGGDTWARKGVGEGERGKGIVSEGEGRVYGDFHFLWIYIFF